MSEPHVIKTPIRELLSRRDVLSRLGIGLPGLALASSAAVATRRRNLRPRTL